MCQTRTRSFSETSFWPTQPLGLLRSRSNSAAISLGQGVRAVSIGFLSKVVRAMALLLGLMEILPSFARGPTGGPESEFAGCGAGIVTHGAGADPLRRLGCAR